MCSSHATEVNFGIPEYYQHLTQFQEKKTTQTSDNVSWVVEGRAAHDSFSHSLTVLLKLDRVIFAFLSVNTTIH